MLLESLILSCGCTILDKEGIDKNMYDFEKKGKELLYHYFRTEVSSLQCS